MTDRSDPPVTPASCAPSPWPDSLVLAGAGKMGGAMLRGWLAQGLPAARIAVVDPAPGSETAALCAGEGVALRIGDVVAPDGPPAVLVLAVKPQVFASAPSTFGALAGPRTLVVSVLAGIRIAALRAALPRAASIVRAMPNLPAAIGRGVSGAAGEPPLGDAHKAIADALLRAVGGVEWLDEAQLDAVTAVSGSGPAYVFLLAECLAEAGVVAGLPAEVAARLARATLEGAGALLAAEPTRSPAALREAVTSPGGTTAAALEVLRARDGLGPLLRRAVAAAAARAQELSR